MMLDTWNCAEFWMAFFCGVVTALTYLYVTEKKQKLLRTTEAYLERSAREFPQLEPGKYPPRRTVYIDYAGAAIPSKSQLDKIRKHEAMIFGNPHTVGDDHDEDARIEVLQRFRCEDYALIWTSGATEACRLVAEHFFLLQQQKGTFLYPVDAHTSVLGMRRIAKRMGATVRAVHDWDDEVPETTGGLAAVTLESNVDGERCPKRVIRGLQGRGFAVVVDAAKYFAFGGCDEAMEADFVIAPSFYKIFGAPTGLGCLLVKRGSAVDRMVAAKRSLGYFGGGGVERASWNEHWEVLRSKIEDCFADGTPHYRGIAALRFGWDEIDRVGGFRAIARHARALGDELRRRLNVLVHATNNSRLVRLYGKGDSSVVAFNVLRDDGSVVSPSLVAALAKARHIIIRAGCVCNVGKCASLLDLSHSDIVAAWERGAACGSADDIHSDGRPLGIVRASFGKDSSINDLDSLVLFIQEAFLNLSQQPNNGEKKIDEPSSIAVPKSSSSSSSYRVDEVMVYPVKGCRGMAVTKWPVLESGRLEKDRAFVVVDETLGVAATAKTHPSLAGIDVAIRDDLLVLTSTKHELEIQVAMALTDEKAVRVCGSERDGVQIADPDGDVSKFFSQILLGYSDADRFRLVSSSSKQSFANSAPVLLVTRRAVAALNNDLQRAGADPVSAAHFRANIVVSETTPSPDFVEESWSSVRLSDLDFDVTGPCERCAAIDVDPGTATKRDGGIVLRTLAALRLNARTSRSKVTFGVFLARPPSSGDNTNVVVGNLCRGDTLTAVVQGPPPPPPPPPPQKS